LIRYYAQLDANDKVRRTERTEEDIELIRSIFGGRWVETWLDKPGHNPGIKDSTWIPERENFIHPRTTPWSYLDDESLTWMPVSMQLDRQLNLWIHAESIEYRSGMPKWLGILNSSCTSYTFQFGESEDKHQFVVVSMNMVSLGSYDKDRDPVMQSISTHCAAEVPKKKFFFLEVEEGRLTLRERESSGQLGATLAELPGAEMSSSWYAAWMADCLEGAQL